MVGILGQFLLPEFEFPLVEVFELAVRERKKLEAFGPLVEVEDVERMAVAVFETAAEAAAPDFLGQFVVPLCLGFRHGSLAVDVDQVQRITGIGSSRDGHVQVRGFAARGRFLQFEQQLVDGKFVTRTGKDAVGGWCDGQHAQAVHAQLVHAEELGAGECLVLFLRPLLRLGISLLRGKE